MQYSELSSQSKRFIKPIGLPEQLRFGTKAYYIARAFALLALLPLSASIVMAITLDGMEQTVYQFAVVILLSLDILLWGYNQRLIFDKPSQQRYVQSSFLGYRFSKIYCASLASTTLLLRPDSYNRNNYQLKLHDLVFVFTSLADAKQALMFLAQHGVPAKEQVSDFPHIREIDIQPIVSSSNESSVETKVEVDNNQVVAKAEVGYVNSLGRSDESTIDDTPDTQQESLDVNLDSIPSKSPLNNRIKPLWRFSSVLRLFYPLPVLMLFGFAVKFLLGAG